MCLKGLEIATNRSDDRCADIALPEEVNESGADGSDGIEGATDRRVEDLQD